MKWLNYIYPTISINLVSDLHFEFGGAEQLTAKITPGPNIDVYVIAGDFFPSYFHWEESQYQKFFQSHNDKEKSTINALLEKRDKAKAYLDALIKTQKHIVFIAGNHDAYDGTLEETDKFWREYAAKYNNFHYLNNDTVEIGDFKFIGCTLLSDVSKFNDIRQVNDFKKIKDWTLEQYQQTFQDNIVVLEKMLTDCRRERQTAIVVSHHAPSFEHIAIWDKTNYLQTQLNVKTENLTVKEIINLSKKIPENIKNTTLNALYASVLTQLIKKHQPSLWCFGHIHKTLNYKINKTHLCCNPRGYFPHQLNSAFNPKLIIKLQAKHFKLKNIL